MEQTRDAGFSLRERFSAIAKSLTKAVHSYPGRHLFISTSRSLRRSLLLKLPRVGEEGLVTYATLPLTSDGHGARKEMLRRFDGNLSLEPKSHHVFSDGRVIWGSTDQIGRERNPSLVSFLSKPKTHLDECISFRGAFENNYFHFFFDTIPKLLLAERYVGADVPVIIGEGLANQRFYREAVDAGLFRSRPVLVQKENELISAKRIWVPTPREPARGDLLEIAGRLKSPAPEERGALRLYVTRGKAAANARRLNNEADLMNCLRKHGFDFFDPQEHSLADQIDKFRQAEIVLAPHGAALTNLIWRQARPLKVIELVNPRFRVDCYEQMSAIMGYDYWSVDNLNCRGNAFRDAGDADVARIDQLLAEIAGPRGHTEQTVSPRSR
jgi:Glycosyltransferase 61